VLREYAAKHGYTIVREYVDEGWSGDTLARPELDNLRNDAKSKTWQAVLIYDPDRLARRYSYQELVLDELRERGIEVIFITVAAPKNSEDKILHGVRGLFAEYERAKIAERFRLGKVRKVKEGHLLVSEPLYGYRYIRNTKDRPGRYEINEEEAGVVRMIFRWIADEGYTMRKVVRRLLEQGIRPRRSKRGVWNTSTLSTMLRHKGYIGETHWGSSYAVVPENPLKERKYKKITKTSRRIRPESEWFKIPVPAIIGKDVFDRARAQLEKNYTFCRRNKKNQYLLAGKIYCPCGRKRSGEGVLNGKHLYYRCTARVLSFPLKASCGSAAVHARVADQLVWERIVELMSSPELLSVQAERWFQERKSSAQSTGDTVAEIDRETAKLKSEEERYSKAYGAGVFTLEQFKKYAEPIRARISTLSIQKMEAEKFRRDDRLVPNPAELRRFTEEAATLLNDVSFQKKREIVLHVIEKVEATTDQLLVRGFIPLTRDVTSSLARDHASTTHHHVEMRSNDRYGLNTNRHDRKPKGVPFMFELNIPVVSVPRHRHRNASGQFS